MSPRRYLTNLILHIRPRTVPVKTLQFTLTWGLGGIAMILILILFGTGIMLKFSYSPFPGRAYESIVKFQNETVYGQLIRNLHHWSSTCIVIIVFLHMLRVFFTGAFHGSRRVNWLVGMGLLITVMLSNFTGYLLPWDQLAYWAITICVGMLGYIPAIGLDLQQLILGGDEVGSQTLSIFYVIHTTFLPCLLFVLLSYHVWRIRKSNGLVVPRKSGKTLENSPVRVQIVPHLLVREMTVAAVLFACLLLFSMCFNAPLTEKANPGLTPNPTKAPWYFMGFQELLVHVRPEISMGGVAFSVLFAAFLLPYIPYVRDTSGIWFVSSPGRISSVISLLTSSLISLFLILTTNIITAVGLYFLAMILITLYLIAKNGLHQSINEILQACFIMIIITFFALTITGIFFRGPNMELHFYWRT